MNSKVFWIGAMLQIKWQILPITALVLIIFDFEMLAAQKGQNIQSGRTANGATEVSLQQLYDSSVQAQDQGDWNRARALLAQIQQSAPEYKDVKKRITTLDSLIALEQKKAQALREELRASGASLNLGLSTRELQGAAAPAQPEKDREQKSSVTGRARDKFEINLTPPPDLLTVQKVNENLELNSEPVKLDNRNERVVADSEHVQSSVTDKAVVVTDRESKTVLAPTGPQISTDSIQVVAAIIQPASHNVATESIDPRPGFSMIRPRTMFASAGVRDKSLMALLSGGIGPKLFLLPLSPEPELPGADTLQVMTAAQYDSLYRCALAFMERHDWHSADIILKQLYSQNPAYRSLSVVYTQVQKHRPPWQQQIPAKLVAIVSKSGALFLIAILTIGLIVITGCRLVCSSVLCARLCLSLGRTEMAEKLCEKIIVRNPGQRAYSCLASIYLKMTRTDAAALKVYQIALKLNPNNRQSEQLSAILAQNYLSANRSDADAVEVLEKAISALIQTKDRKA